MLKQNTDLVMLDRRSKIDPLSWEDVIEQIYNSIDMEPGVKHKEAARNIVKAFQTRFPYKRFPTPGLVKLGFYGESLHLFWNSPPVGWIELTVGLSRGQSEVFFFMQSSDSYISTFIKTLERGGYSKQGKANDSNPISWIKVGNMMQTMFALIIQKYGSKEAVQQLVVLASS